MAGSAYAATNFFVKEAQSLKADRLDEIKRVLFRLKRNKPAVIGFIIVGIIIFSAIFAEFIIPYPEHVGAYIDFENMNNHQVPNTA